MLLEYNFAVVGAANVEKALASIERRFAQHNARVNSMLGTRGPAAARGPGAATSANREATAAIRKLEREQIASAKRVERERIASERAVARAQQLASNETFRQRKRERAEAAAEAASSAKARAEFVRGTVGRGVGRVFGAARAVGAAGLALTGVGGAALAASAVSQATSLDDTSRRLAIQGRGIGEQGVDPDALRRKFTSTGIAHGMAPESVASGAAAYTAINGDLTSALEQLDTFATTAQAAGGDIKDMATVAAQFSKLGITSIPDVQKALADLAFQGKKGAFELKDMAAELPELLSQGASLGIKGNAGLAQMGGMLQVVQKATNNAPETSTAISNMFRMFISKAPKMASGEEFGGNKVDVFSDKGHTKFRDFRSLIGETVDAARGDITKLNDAFEIRGSKALNPFTTAYNTTRDAALKGGASDKDARAQGKAAALAILDDASNAGGDFKELQRDATDAMKGFGVQLEIIES